MWYSEERPPQPRQASVGQLLLLSSGAQEEMAQDFVLQPSVPPHPKDCAQPVRTGEMSEAVLGTADKSGTALPRLTRMRSSVILNRQNETWIRIPDN